MNNSLGLTEEEMRTFIAHESSEIHRIYQKLFTYHKAQSVELIVLSDTSKLPVLQGHLQVHNRNLNYMNEVRTIIRAREMGNIVPIRR